MSAEQRQVVEHGAGPLRVRGRAGTGKTTALVARYLELAGAVPPSHILFVCRSREAVGAVRDVVLPQLAGGFDALPIATFDTVAFDVLARGGAWPRRMSVAERRTLVRDGLFGVSAAISARVVRVSRDHCAAPPTRVGLWRRHGSGDGRSAVSPSRGDCDRDRATPRGEAPRHCRFRSNACGRRRLRDGNGRDGPAARRLDSAGSFALRRRQSRRRHRQPARRVAALLRARDVCTGRADRRVPTTDLPGARAVQPSVGRARGHRRRADRGPRGRRPLVRHGRARASPEPAGARRHTRAGPPRHPRLGQRRAPPRRAGDQRHRRPAQVGGRRRRRLDRPAGLAAGEARSRRGPHAPPPAGRRRRPRRRRPPRRPARLAERTAGPPGH